MQKSGHLSLSIEKNTLNLTEKDNSFMICYQAFIMVNVLPSLSVIQPNVDWITSCMIPVKNQCLIFNGSHGISMAAMVYKWQLWYFNGSYGILVVVIVFLWQLWYLNFSHGILIAVIL